MASERRPEGPESERAFDSVAEAYDGWYATTLGAVVDSLERDLLYQIARPRAGETALDVGTGTGHFALDLTRLGLTAVGLDLSKPMLEVARSKEAGLCLLRGDASRLPLVGGRFNLVLSVTALEFIAERGAALREMWRVVRPGGRLLVAALNAWSPWAWKRHLEARRTNSPFCHAHFFQPSEFVSMLQQFGPVKWSSSVFIGPSGEGMRWAWALERFGRRFVRRFGALLVGEVAK
jgi:ubiquinone/menaquinone biosynthesis C-methylase UbiE